MRNSCVGGSTLLYINIWAHSVSVLYTLYQHLGCVMFMWQIHPYRLVSIIVLNIAVVPCITIHHIWTIFACTYFLSGYSCVALWIWLIRTRENNSSRSLQVFLQLCSKLTRHRGEDPSPLHLLSNHTYPRGCSLFSVVHLCLISLVYSYSSEITDRCFQGCTLTCHPLHQRASSHTESIRDCSVCVGVCRQEAEWF